LAVEVELFGHLATTLPKQQMVVLEHLVTAWELAIQLGVNPDEVGFVAINGKHEEMSEIVPEDSRICFFPPLSGG
jgi:molybdopterin converting factor small subunit